MRLSITRGSDAPIRDANLNSPTKHTDDVVAAIDAGLIELSITSSRRIAVQLTGLAEALGLESQEGARIPLAMVLTVEETRSLAASLLDKCAEAEAPGPLAPYRPPTNH
jgi:hypothetical protein